MSINFKCHCGNEMTVSDEMKGKRGKCPECGRLVTVPDYSSNSLVVSDNGYFKSPRLNQLFLDFLDKHDDDIKNCRILDDIDKDTEGAVLEIYTRGGRTQIVRLYRIKLDEMDVLVSHTVIGRNPDYEGFTDILIDLAVNLPVFPTYAVKINKDRKEISLEKVTRLEFVDSNVFEESVFQMAIVADRAEEEHYDNDVN